MNCSKPRRQTQKTRQSKPKQMKASAIILAFHTHTHTAPHTFITRAAHGFIRCWCFCVILTNCYPSSEMGTMLTCVNHVKVVGGWSNLSSSKTTINDAIIHPECVKWNGNNGFRKLRYNARSTAGWEPEPVVCFTPLSRKYTRLGQIYLRIQTLCAVSVSYVRFA